MIKKILLASLVCSLSFTSAKAQNVSDETCIAQAIYYEANAESYLGKQAVAHVILNRVKSRHYPNTVCGVVYQRSSRGSQFSWYHGGSNYRTNEISRRVAREALNGVSSDPTGGSLYFWATRIGTPRYVRRGSIMRIGGHSFAK